MGRFLGLLIAFILVVPILRALLGLIGRMFTNFTGAPSKDGRVDPARVPAGGTLRKDPVCGTFVSETVAKTLTSGGKTHHFCSDECLKKFAGESGRT